MLCSLNGARCPQLTLTIPGQGLWVADAVLDDVIEFSGTAVTIVLLDLTLTGSVYRSADYSGVGYLRIVGGHGGWLQEIPSAFYQNPHGVKLGPVLQDAARAVGETVVIDEDITLGTFFTREAGVACRVLNQTSTSWYVQTDGKTHIGTRPAYTIGSRFSVTDEGVAPNIGRLTVATEAVADWMPGARFSDPIFGDRVFQVSDVVHNLTPERLRTEVWTV